MRKWSKNEDEFLKDRFPGGSIPYAMQMLNRSAYEVRCRVMHLKLDENMIFETVKIFR